MKTDVPKVWSVALCHHRIGVVAPSALEICGMVSEESCRETMDFTWCLFVALRTMDSSATVASIDFLFVSGSIASARNSSSNGHPKMTMFEGIDQTYKRVLSASHLQVFRNECDPFLVTRPTFRVAVLADIAKVESSKIGLGLHKSRNVYQYYYWYFYYHYSSIFTWI